MKHPPCFVCTKAAVHRCDECSPDGKLFLCGDTECFNKMHNEFVATRHRLLLVAWDSKVKWTVKCCATHVNKPLEYWCDACRVPVCQQCWSHGKHVGHSTSLVTDVWQPLQAELRKTAKALDAKVAEHTQRLDKLAAIRDEAGGCDVIVGSARRALDKIEVQFADKIRALRVELEAAAASWRANAADEHNELARQIASARMLARKMREVCDEREESCAQEVVLKYGNLSKWRDALQTPIWTSVPVETATVVLAEAALTKLTESVADLSFARACTYCEGAYVGAVGACASCLASFAKQGRFQSDEEVLGWSKDHTTCYTSANSLDVAAVYNNVGNVCAASGASATKHCSGTRKHERYWKKHRTADLSVTRHKTGSVFYKQGTFANRVRGQSLQQPQTLQSDENLLAMLFS